MKTFKNQTITGQALVLEECYFVDCLLVDCDLFYAGGEFDCVNLRWEKCRFHWCGSAARTLKMLQIAGVTPQNTPIVTPETGAAKPN